MLKIPHFLLNILILIFCVIGSYSMNQQLEDVYLLIIAGFLGYMGKKLGYEPAPAILAFVLGPKIEGSLRQALIISDGSFSIFFTRPITAVFMFVTALILITAITPAKKKLGFLMQNRCKISLDKQKQPPYTSTHRKQCLIKGLCG